MGYWDEGIMGGDTPLDIKSEFEDCFGSDDEEFNRERIEDGEDPIPYRIPTVKEAIEFLHYASYTFEHDEARQVTGWLLMERGAPLNAELRKFINEGIDLGLSDGCETWSHPQIRIKRLEEFRAMLAAYPDEGTVVEMPDSPGLFDKMTDFMNGSKSG